MNDNCRTFTESLMLAIVAPDEENMIKAMKLASQFGERLTQREQELCKMGIETCMEYLRKYPENYDTIKQEVSR